MESEFSALFLLLSLCTHEGNFMLENCRVQSGNFKTALDICQKNRSELADVNRTREKIKSCDRIKKEDMHMFLVNEVAVQTPVLDLLGCFQVSDYRPRDRTPVSSIPECFSYCHPLKKFGVSGQSRLHCLCINPNTKVVREQSLDPSRCRVDDSQSSTYMEVYAVLDDKKKSDEEHFQMKECRIITLQETIETTLVSASRVRGYCFYPFCRNRTDINSIPTECEDSWDAATQACLSKTNSYLADSIQLSDCHYVARKIQNVFRTATFWSSRRSYNADFSVKGNKSKGSLIEVSKCVVVSKNEKREVSCDEDNNFFCLDHVDNIRESPNEKETPPDQIPIIITVILLVLAVVLAVPIIALIRRKKLENWNVCYAEPRPDEGYSKAETDDTQERSTTVPKIKQEFPTTFNNEGETSQAGKKLNVQEEHPKEALPEETKDYTLSIQATKSHNSHSLSEENSATSHVGVFIEPFISKDGVIGVEHG